VQSAESNDSFKQLPEISKIDKNVTNNENNLYTKKESAFKQNDKTSDDSDDDSDSAFEFSSDN